VVAGAKDRGRWRHGPGPFPRRHHRSGPIDSLPPPYLHPPRPDGDRYPSQAHLFPAALWRPASLHLVYMLSRRERNSPSRSLVPPRRTTSSSNACAERFHAQNVKGATALFPLRRSKKIHDHQRLKIKCDRQVPCSSCRASKRPQVRSTAFSKLRFAFSETRLRKAVPKWYAWWRRLRGRDLTCDLQITSVLARALGKFAACTCTALSHGDFRAASRPLLRISSESA
jgi:hypothetical protein